MTIRYKSIGGGIRDWYVDTYSEVSSLPTPNANDRLFVADRNAEYVYDGAWKPRGHRWTQGTISSGATFTSADDTVTCLSSKTTMIHFVFCVKRTDTGASAYISRTIGVEYVSAAFAFIGHTATTVAGADVSEESSTTGFDAQFVLNTSTGVVTIQAKAPAAGSFSVQYVVTEL